VGAGERPVDVVVLGSGTSHGVPMIACDCPVCTSDDPRDQRSRCSVFVRCGQTNLLIDTAPELRLQCVACDVRRVDAVLFTHHHADHVVGLDDVRRFNWLQREPLRCYGVPRTTQALRRMFLYAFEGEPYAQHSRPALELIDIDKQPFDIGDALVVPIPLMHGPTPVFGFRLGRFAYCTDCNAVPAESWPLLEGLDVLILDAVRKTPHPTHYHLDEAMAVARRVGARMTYFTHIAHEIKHEDVEAELPEGMGLAYDGLRVRVPETG
jgi:phosphoribosyl 1,2-cyclic phosphate phosphodiesterase